MNRWFGLVGFAVVLLLLQAREFNAATSATYDEPLYAQLGCEVVYHHSFEGLVKPMTPPLPILLVHAPAALVCGSADPQPAEIARLVSLARGIHSIVVGTVLLLLIAVWLHLRCGGAAAAFAALMAALSPNFIAHSAVAATDVFGALMALLGVAGLCRYASRPNGRTFLLTAGLAGLALATKQSAAFLFPSFALLGWWLQCRAGRSLGRAFVNAVGRTVALVAIAFLVNWACYGFLMAPVLAPSIEHESITKLIGTSPPGQRLNEILETIPVPASITTFVGQVAHGMRGHSAYFLGEVRHRGWTAYYPVAVAVKCTPAELVLFTLGLIAALRQRHTWDVTRRVWMICSAVIAFTSLTSTLDLGIRYLAPLYPLVLLISVDALWRSPPCSRALRLGLPLALVLWQMVSALSVFQWGYLSYFNSLAGGPENGHRWLADSNLDWGQGLIGLQTAMRAHGDQRVIIAYFGDSDPAAYGVDSVQWNTEAVEGFEHCQIVAISTSYLCGVVSGRDTFAAFRDLEPDRKAMHCFWIYDLSRPEVRAALSHARRHIGLTN